MASLTGLRKESARKGYSSKEYLSARGLGVTSAQVGLDRVTDNAKVFARQLEKLASFVEDTVIDKIIRKTCFDLYATIVERTPVDIGTAKANWSITAHEPSTEVHSADRPLMTHNDFDYKVQDDKVTIYNNLEYIEALEDGHSQQAPAGMVAVSLAEFNIKLDKNMRASGLI